MHEKFFDDEFLNEVPVNITDPVEDEIDAALDEEEMLEWLYG